MKKSEDIYRDVIDDLTEFVVRWKSGGTRTFVNKAYCDYYGITPEQAIGTSFMPLVAEEYRQAVEKRISRLTPENSVSTGEHKVKRPDGSIGWNEWTDRAIFDDKDRLVEFLSVGQDITERKKTEKEIRNRVEELENFYKIAITREIKMKQQKAEIKKLKSELSKYKQ